MQPSRWNSGDTSTSFRQNGRSNYDAGRAGKEKTMSNITLMTVPEAPIQQINRDQIEAAINRVRFIIPNGQEMTTAQVTAIAQEAILYRIVPGRDVHYFVNKGQLQKVLDYKYLKNFATFKEQLLSGDDTATLEDNYRPLTDQERAQHNIVDAQIAAMCTISTRRERAAFAAEVKQWIEMGFKTGEAVALARETYGSLGTQAIGVVFKGDTPPKGWSHYQLAEKLAFKNAVNRKYGQPTADEMAAMAHRMARRAMPEHWQNVDVSQPIEAQAKQADYEAITSEIIQAHGEMTPEERQEQLARNIVIMRGTDDEDGIGDDYEAADLARFAQRVIEAIPWYRSNIDVAAAMATLELVYDPETEDMTFDALARYADNEASRAAGV